MLRRVAGSDEIGPLRTLADVVEPVKNYDREALAKEPATSLTPLNRLVDAVRPESVNGRHFAESVDALIASGGTDQEKKSLVLAELIAVQRSVAQLQVQQNGSFLLMEVVPLADSMSKVAAAGSEAVDYMYLRQEPPESWETEQLALIREGEKPKAQLLLTIAPSVEKLVQAAAGKVTTAPQK
jgi:hexosaminidase